MSTLQAAGWAFAQRHSDLATPGERWFGCPAMPAYVHGLSEAECASECYVEAVRGARQMREQFCRDAWGGDDLGSMDMGYFLAAGKDTGAAERRFGIPAGWISR